MSPDPMNAGADMSDPQTWNGYAYVRNNPLALVGPSGMDPDPCNGNLSTCWRNPAAYSQYISQQKYAGADLAYGWTDPFELQSLAFKPTAALVVTAPYDYGDNPDFGNVFLVPIYGNVGALSIVDALAQEGTDAILDPGPGSCPLQLATGQYNSAPTEVGGFAVAWFMPPMANALSAAFASLNSKGITPTITSGFRTAADQQRMIQGGSGGNPAAKVSPHQVGMAVDIAGVNSTIINAMTARGLTWGGTFVTRQDPPRFQLLQTPPPALVKACQGGNRAGH